MHTFADPLHHAERTRGGREAVSCATAADTRRLTFGELAARCRRLAGALTARGIAPGERVALFGLNSLAYLETYLAVPASGRVIVPLNIRHAEPELRYALEDSGARVLITDQDPGGLADLVEQVIRIPDEYESTLAGATEEALGAGVTEETLAGLFYTGGTTGASKGVMLTHRNLIANALHYLLLEPITPQDVFLVMAPMFHAAGTVHVLAAIWTGARQVLQPIFDPAAVLDSIEREGVTFTFGVPTMIAAMVEEQLRSPRDTARLRMVQHGGSPIATEVVRRASATFPSAEILHLYGATETAPLVTGLHHEERLLDTALARSCGQPVAGVEVRILGAGGEEFGIGEIGEVAIRGPNVMAGYWKKPEQTAAALRDGWYWSGDMGYLDEESHLFLVDRSKDMIVSGGENVYCTEVEEVLYKHPAVLEAAVFGVPDDRWGEAVHAVVVPREETDSQDLPARLISFCREHIAGYKVPKAIDIRTDPLPKSGPGKVLKRELRRPFWEGRESQVN